MSKITELASGRLTNNDALVVVLSQPDDMPAYVIVHWPTKPTVCTPQNYDQTIANAMRILAAASTAIAGLKARKKL
jgi:hypothetical protein